jgi:hypothetical protein
MSRQISILAITRKSLSNPDQISRSIGARTFPILNALKIKHNIIWESAHDEHVKFKDLLKYDYILFNTHNSNKAVELIKFCKEFQISTIYDLDDWMFNIPSYSVMRLDENRIENMVYMLKEASLVTVSNQNLKNRVNFLRPDSIVVCNGFIPKLGFDFENKKKFDSPKIIFTSTDNLKLTKYAPNFLRQLNNFFDRYPEVVMDFWGDGIPEVSLIKNINSCGVLSFPEYYELICNRDYIFAVSPLGGPEDVDDYVYNTSKTCIKYVNYGSSFIPGIYSNTTPYAEYVSDCNTGLLVNNHGDEWFVAMTKLYECKNLRNLISKNAYIDCCQNHNLLNIVDGLFSAL